jgi:RNA polymerase sigma factor (sigma-70 family)
MGRAAAGQYPTDLELVHAITGGSEVAWHEFVERYTGLILTVLRRYLFDEEEARNCCVGVLEGLYRGKLATYQGRATLASWLAAVSRSAARDALRRRFGRREVPASLRRLGELPCEAFRLYYIEGLSFDAVRHWVRPHGEPMSAEELCGVLQDIDAKVTDRTLRRVAYDLGATSVGAASGRMLEFLEHYSREVERAEWAASPECVLLRREIEEFKQRLQEGLAKLPEADRRALMLRFDRGWSAEQIAGELKLASPEKAYPLVRRALRRLRKLLPGSPNTGLGP